MPLGEPPKPDRAKKWADMRAKNSADAAERAKAEGRKPGGTINHDDLAIYSPKRKNPYDMAVSRARVARMYLQGKSIHEIGKIEGVSAATINRDLSIIKMAWMASALLDLDARKAQELARLDELEATSWDAWQRSKADKRSISRKTSNTVGDEGEALKDEERRYSREQRTGNVLYLEMVMKCIERRCKILGLDAPERSQMELALTSAQRHQVEFVDRVIGNPEAVRHAHTILALTSPVSESAPYAGRPGGDAERGPLDPGEALASTVDALMRTGGWEDQGPDSGNAPEAWQE